MRKRFAEKDDHGAEAGAKRGDGGLTVGFKQAQFAAVAALPVFIQVKNRRNHPVSGPL